MNNELDRPDDQADILLDIDAKDTKKKGKVPRKQEEPKDMLKYERDCWESDFEAVAGIDEVGRGCLFGDVVAAAVILPKGLILDGVDDSKKISAKKRDALYDVIMENAIAVGIGHVDAETIDQINIKQAARLAMKKALESLSCTPDYLLVDAEKVDSSIPQMAIIKGDANSQSIAAASIIAKVTRDRLCEGLWEEMYPGYGIAVHKGYATKLHRTQLEELGPTKLHRKSFLKNFNVEQQTLF